MITTAWMSESTEQDQVICQACSHLCKIKPGHRGICGVRKNENGELKLLVYGKSVAANIDPVEKKPLYHFYPGSSVYSIGTVGCNFRCDFCQNSDISQYHKSHGEDEIIQAGMNLMPESIIDFCLKENIGSIAYTYNEPAIFFEYAYDTAKLAHEKGLKNIYVSNGFETRRALESILPYLDAINIDLKSYQSAFYQKICGGKLDPVLDNIRFLWQAGIWTEVTTLIIPGSNDRTEEFENISRFLADISPDIPWHISRFFPCYKMLEVPSTPMSLMKKAYEIGKKNGLRYVYTGNVPHDGLQSTYCPECRTEVISREGYRVRNHMKEGHCPECNATISGKYL